MTDKPTQFWHNLDDLPPKLRGRAWSLIAEQFDHLIDDFYVHIGRSGVQDHLNGVDIATLKSKQRDHWATMFMSRADSDHQNRMDRMYKRHREIGLTSETYLKAYMFLLTRFHRAILAGASGPAEAYHLIEVANTIVANDIHRAMETYFAPAPDTVIALD